MIDDVQSVSYYDGATVVQHWSGGWGGITLGSYINGSMDIEANSDNQLFQHEFGYTQERESMLQKAEVRHIQKHQTPKGILLMPQMMREVLITLIRVIGKPETITSAGSSWTMLYGNYGRQTSLNDPNAGTVSYGYNNFGELTSQTDSRNLTRSLTYDNLGRVLTQISPEGTKTFAYDPTGNPGLLSSVTFPGGSETYNYDSYSRLTSKVESIDGTNYATGYGYDSYSRLETVTYPSNFAIKNVYNNFGYQSEVRRNDNNSLIWQGQDVNAFGHFTRYTYGNNLTTTKAYNSLGMLWKVRF